MNNDRAASTSLVPVVGALALWLAVASLISATGVLARLPIPPPALALALTALCFLLLWIAPSLRKRIRDLGPTRLVAFHLLRLGAGLYFLVLYGRGILPGEFAIFAGWGDILVGLAVLPVLWFCIPVRTAHQLTGLLLWNSIGLADILLVLANALRLFLRGPQIVAPFARLPLSLLPTFVVPIVLVSHVLLFVWAGDRRETRDSRRL